MFSRPSTLAEVARRVLGGGAFLGELADFLDEFRAAPGPGRLEEAPPPLDGQVPRGRWKDAYLAAAAEHLASREELATPPWAFDKRRYLEHPAFACRSRAARLFLLKDSPAAFKSRNLFVSGNALERA